MIGSAPTSPGKASSRNPYRPGAGRIPPALVGRDALMGAIARTMDVAEEDGSMEQPLIVWGLRGMGKTVILRSAIEDARARGWLVIATEAYGKESLARSLSQAIAEELRQRERAGRTLGRAAKFALSVLRSFQLRFEASGAAVVRLDVDPAKGHADTGDDVLDLKDLLSALGEAAREEGSGVLVAIDELQETPLEDLDVLNRSLHALGQDYPSHPIAFIGAGLPDLPQVLSEATSYAERMYRYTSIGRLTDEEVARALREPAGRLGVAWDREALKTAWEYSRGYPYLVQECGRAAWDERSSEEMIAGPDCARGIELVRERMSEGIYRARWERASEAEREFMRAMAQDGGPTSVADIAARMGKGSQRGVSVIRRRLMNAGQIYSPERGLVDFAVPGFDDYIRRNADLP